MLPSTSSPVEAAPTPVSPIGPLPCQPQHVGEAKEGAGQDQCPPPRLARLGMCGAEEAGREGRAARPPPDLCAGDTPGPQRHGNRARSVEEALGGAAVAQGACDYQYALNDSRCGGQGGDAAEEGACGPASSRQCPEEAAACRAEEATCGPKAALPDLCDTGGGARHRTNHKTSGADVPAEEMQCELPGEAGGGREDMRESGGGRPCQGYGSDVGERRGSDLKDDVVRVVSEADGGMEEESAAADGVGNVPLKPDDALEENGDDPSRDGSGVGDAREVGDVYRDDGVDANDSHDLEMAVGPLENYLIHDNRQISLVACGITQCDPSFRHDATTAEASETEDGTSLIKYNLHHSSHPMYDKWPCYFYITEEHLPNFTVDSHGRHVGSDTPPMFFPSPSVSRPASHLTEEEQVKIAKRMGLITHLPCGIFDGTKKSGECVICMIDFSVGDRVRYLPCMHTYHTECIDDWLMRSFTCPSCLEPVDAALLNTYGTS